MTAIPNIIGAGLLRAAAAARHQRAQRPGAVRRQRVESGEILLERVMDSPDAVRRMLRGVERALRRGAPHVRINCSLVRCADSTTVAALVAVARRLRRCGATCELVGAEPGLLVLIDLHQVRGTLGAAGMAVPAAA